MTEVLNAMTVDVEDYFQVSAFETHIPRSSWDSLESRVCANTDRLLELFDASGVRSTFFVLGWVAQRFPRLVHRIHQAGHELASHGYDHRLVYETHPSAFREDVRRARAAIEDAAGTQVWGYRAPSYSITRRSMWALDVLIGEGYRYDASIYPIRHDRYGIPDWPRHIQRIDRDGGTIFELPGSTVRRCGMNLPVGGGGYFRQLPYAWTRWGISEINRSERLPAIFYLHPWEIDPGQPQVAVGLVARLRHYRNLTKTEERLRRLLGEFRFGPISEVLHGMAASTAA